MSPVINPFVAIPTMLMSPQEMLNALRLDMISELEAIITYESQAAACDDPVVSKLLRSVADEERVHVGELQRLIQYLDGRESELLAKGKSEVDTEASSVKDEIAPETKPVIEDNSKKE